MNLHDPQLLILLGAIFGLLIVASLIGYVLSLRTMTLPQQATIANLNARIRAWWLMCIVFMVALSTGLIGAVILFGLISLLALREFVTLTPTRRADHEPLLWSFFVILPLQYVLVEMRWYGMFAIMIPVYGFLFLPARAAIAGDTRDFLERTAKTQWGIMVCVYCVSYAPALLMLDIDGYTGQNAKLLLFLVVVVQLSDVMQYVFGKLFGKHKIVPKLSPNKTVEGFVGGVLGASAIGMAMCWMTPFSVWAAAAIALLIALAGFAGGLCMSAIKRDSGIKDFGALIEGHGGVLDRIDSLCFAAPIFFHVVHYYYM